MRKPVSAVVAAIVIIVVLGLVVALMFKFSGPPRVRPAHPEGGERGGGISLDVSKIKGAAPAAPSEKAPAESAETGGR